MVDKINFIIKIISGLIINIFLIYFFLKSENLVTELAIIPFLICGLAMLTQIIFNYLNKQKYVEILHKIYICSFLLFWFGFLAVWSYVAIKDEKYSLLVFSIPFFIAGIYIIYKYLIKKSKD